MWDLLRLPHHDGSPAYVDNAAPRLGDTVTVRMRSHTDDPIEDVWLRTTSSCHISSARHVMQMTANPDPRTRP